MTTARGRIAAFVLAGLAGTATASCGGQPAGKPTPTVAYLAPNLTRPYALEIADGFRSGVAEVSGVQQVVSGPPTDNDPVAQADLFGQLLDTAPGGISVSMSAPERFVDSLAAATGRHVPVIAVDNPGPSGAGPDLYVGNDNQELGIMLADLVIERLPAKARGAVLLGNSKPGIPVLDLRAAAVRAEFQKRRPDIQVLGPFDTASRPDVSLKAWRQLLAANAKPLALLSVGADGPTLADVRRITKGRWLAASFDLDPVSLAAVKRGELLLVSPEHFLKGAVAGRLQAEHADHQTPLPKGWIYIPGLAVTPKNVDSIIARQLSVASRQAWFQPRLDQMFGPSGPELRDLNQVR
jgi:ribose transport system substrate-binding protein